MLEFWILQGFIDLSNNKLFSLLNVLYQAYISRLHFDYKTIATFAYFSQISIFDNSSSFFQIILEVHWPLNNDYGIQTSVKLQNQENCTFNAFWYFQRTSYAVLLVLETENEHLAKIKCPLKTERLAYRNVV